MSDTKLWKDYTHVQLSIMSNQERMDLYYKSYTGQGTDVCIRCGSKVRRINIYWNGLCRKCFDKNRGYGNCSLCGMYDQIQNDICADCS